MDALHCSGYPPLDAYRVGETGGPSAKVFMLMKVAEDFDRLLPTDAVSARGFYDCLEASILKVKNGSLTGEEIASLYVHTAPSPRAYRLELWDRIEELAMEVAPDGAADDWPAPAIFYAVGDSYDALKPYFEKVKAKHLRALRRPAA